MDYESDVDVSFEPVVIINDGSDFEDNDNIFTKDESEEDPLEFVDSEIPVNKSKRKPHIKIRLFEKEYSPSKDDDSGQKVQSVPRNSKVEVKLVSKEEADLVPDTYQRRKSLPLEKCPICKKYFRRMATHLTKHEKTSQEANDPLTCTFCSKIFNTQSNLLIHVRTHTGQKPYICEVCNKGFAQSCNLVNHMRVHSGEKPFKCPHCDRGFTQSGNLNNHIRLHTNEKPFQCHFCDKAFVQSGNLSSHIKNNHKFLFNAAEDNIEIKKEESN